MAVASRSSDGDLSLRLAELAKPSVRLAPPAAQAEQLGLVTEGAGSLLRDGNRVLVEARFEGGPAAVVEALRAAGAKVVHISPRYQTVTVAAKPAELRWLSAIPRVASVTEVLKPVAAASTCPSGVAVSEGDEQLRAAEARTSFGLDGSGVTVGILSDSFDQATEAVDGSGPIATHADDDVESGDLPGSGNTCAGQMAPVDVLEDWEPGPGEGEPVDEGRAMAQIVHDLAPGAELAFATAFTGLTAFADNVKALAAAGAKVIADDVTYFEEPFFQEGPVGVAVGEASAGGVSYFSSAANNNLVDGGKDIASWEATQFRDSQSCPGELVALSEALEELGEPGLNPAHCMDFNPGPAVDRTFRITVAKDATLIVDLQWAEPWEGVGTDVDAFLLDPGGTIVTGSAEDNVFGSQRPFEFVGWENDTGAPVDMRLVVNRYEGGNPRLKLAILQNGAGVTSTEYESSLGGDVVGPTIFGHNGAEDAISVGAMRYGVTEAPEKYSSRGPVTHHFGPVNGPTAAEPLASPAVLSKPDLTATDCGVTTFFASFVSAEGAWRFCGTSAAAPHAAAVAALMLQQDPTATPEEIRSALAESATPIGASGPCTVGAGLVDAQAAIELLASGETGVEPAPCLPPESGPWPVEEEGGIEPPLIAVAPDTQTPNELTPPPPSDMRPQTFFRRHPQKVVRTRHSRAKVVFRFGADEAGVTFLCRMDGEPFQACPPRFVRRLRAGAHVLRVVARDATGDIDGSPAVYRFTVRRR